MFKRDSSWSSSRCLALILASFSTFLLVCLLGHYAGRYRGIVSLSQWTQRYEAAFISQYSSIPKGVSNFLMPTSASTASIDSVDPLSCSTQGGCDLTFIGTWPSTCAGCGPLVNISCRWTYSWYGWYWPGLRVTPASLRGATAHCVAPPLPFAGAVALQLAFTFASAPAAVPSDGAGPDILVLSNVLDYHINAWFSAAMDQSTYVLTTVHSGVDESLLLRCNMLLRVSPQLAASVGGQTAGLVVALDVTALPASPSTTPSGTTPSDNNLSSNGSLVWLIPEVGSLLHGSALPFRLPMQPVGSGCVSLPLRLSPQRRSKVAADGSRSRAEMINTDNSVGTGSVVLCFTSPPQRFHRSSRRPTVTWVDHLSRSLVIGGVPTPVSGWLYEPVRSPFHAGAIDCLRTISALSPSWNAVMMYGLGKLVESDVASAMLVFDEAHARGIGIFVEVVEYFISRNLSALRTVVNSVSLHPALIGYYICDDSCGKDPGVYRGVRAALRALDPFHVTVGAVNAATYYTDILDIPFFETYVDDDYAYLNMSGAAEKAAQYAQWPRDWLFTGAAGQAFSGMGSAAVSVLGMSSLIGGGFSSNMWFIFGVDSMYDNAVGDVASRLQRVFPAALLGQFPLSTANATSRSTVGVVVDVGDSDNVIGGSLSAVPIVSTRVATRCAAVNGTQGPGQRPPKPSRYVGTDFVQCGTFVDRFKCLVVVLVSYTPSPTIATVNVTIPLCGNSNSVVPCFSPAEVPQTFVVVGELNRLAQPTIYPNNAQREVTLSFTEPLSGMSVREYLGGLCGVPPPVAAVQSAMDDSVAHCGSFTPRLLRDGPTFRANPNLAVPFGTNLVVNSDFLNLSPSGAAVSWVLLSAPAVQPSVPILVGKTLYVTYVRPFSMPGEFASSSETALPGLQMRSIVVPYGEASSQGGAIVVVPTVVPLRYAAANANAEVPLYRLSLALRPVQSCRFDVCAVVASCQDSNRSIAEAVLLQPDEWIQLVGMINSSHMPFNGDACSLQLRASQPFTFIVDRGSSIVALPYVTRRI